MDHIPSTDLHVSGNTQGEIEINRRVLGEPESAMLIESGQLYLVFPPINKNEVAMGVYIQGKLFQKIRCEEPSQRTPESTANEMLVRPISRQETNTAPRDSFLYAARARPYSPVLSVKTDLFERECGCGNLNPIWPNGI